MVELNFVDKDFRISVHRGKRGFVILPRLILIQLFVSPEFEAGGLVINIMPE